tara:strand:+ start:126 stop:248 length:123 start_codon:yes stop_codon:yes gene_type:complete
MKYDGTKMIEKDLGYRENERISLEFPSFYEYGEDSFGWVV